MEANILNPTGINGIEFVEYSGADIIFFETLFKKWGFKEVGAIPGKKIKLFMLY